MTDVMPEQRPVDLDKLVDGVPVSAGGLDAVDEQLLREGRLRSLTAADALVVARKERGTPRPTRAPDGLLDCLLTALEG